jgi:hypothetical protein
VRQARTSAAASLAKLSASPGLLSGRSPGDGKCDRPPLLNGWDSELSEFARDSPLEEAGFEPLVPPLTLKATDALGS